MKQPRRNERGDATVEAVLAVPVLLLLILMVVQFGLWYHASHTAKAAAQEGVRAVRTEGAAATTLGSEPRPVSAALACRFRQPPTALDDWAVVDVRPVLHPLASGREVAIGYAQSHRSATGGILDIGSLRLERQFWQQQDRQVFSVTPLEVDGTLRYHVERQGTSVAFARAVAAEPPARVGASENAVVLGKLEQRAQSFPSLRRLEPAAGGGGDSRRPRHVALEQLHDVGVVACATGLHLERDQLGERGHGQRLRLRDPHSTRVGKALGGSGCSGLALDADVDAHVEQGAPRVALQTGHERMMERQHGRGQVGTSPGTRQVRLQPPPILGDAHGFSRSDR